MLGLSAATSLAELRLLAAKTERSCPVAQRAGEAAEAMLRPGGVCDLDCTPADDALVKRVIPLAVAIDSITKRLCR